MHLSLATSIIRRLCALMVVAAMNGGALHAQHAPPAAPRAENTHAASILFVSNDDPDRPYVRQFADGLRQGLNSSGVRSTLFREFFDQIRFGGALADVVVKIARDPGSLLLLRSNELTGEILKAAVAGA